MDVEETKKIIQSKIEAESLTKQVRNEIKSYIHEKQNLREGFKETFKPLIESQDKVKEGIDNQQNAMIKQLQENQLALTEGLDKNRLATTQGFDKMDEVKKWDLLQLPDYEAIEEPEESEEIEKQKLIKKYTIWRKKCVLRIKNYMIQIKKLAVSKLLAEAEEPFDTEKEELFKSIISDETDEESAEVASEEATEESAAEKSKVATFDRDYFDKGLVYKGAKDILYEYKIRRPPSVYMDKSIEKVYGKLEKVKEYLNDIKLKLKDTTKFEFDEKEGFEIALPISGRPQPKTKDLIEKQYSKEICTQFK